MEENQMKISKERWQSTNGTLAKNEPGVPTSSLFDPRLSMYIYTYIKLFDILPVLPLFVLAACKAGCGCLGEVRMKMDA